MVIATFAFSFFCHAASAQILERSPSVLHTPAKGPMRRRWEWKESRRQWTLVYRRMFIGDCERQNYDPLSNGQGAVSPIIPTNQYEIK